MHKPGSLQAYMQITDKLIQHASKEEIADVARLLAINLGYYYQQYGEVPQDELLELIKTEQLNHEQTGVSVAGMKNLIAALMEVTGLDYTIDDEYAS